MLKKGVKNKRLIRLTNVDYSNPIRSIQTVLNYSIIFKEKYRLKLEGVETLFLIYSVYPASISVNGLHDLKIACYQTLRIRLQTLCNTGLIEVVGKGRFNCNLYSVSQLFLDDIKGFGKNG